MEDRKQHWETVFSTRAQDELSWFQEYPVTSMEFLEGLNLPLSANIIDIGGGDSSFVDALLNKGYQNVWVLDISAAAFERAKIRLGEKAELVHWIVSDVTEFEPPIKFDCWHDRAAFHFLTSNHAINKYVAIAGEGIVNNGYLVLGTFSENGPEKCSGLQVQRYSETSMIAQFAIAFRRIKCITENHVTPFKTVQNFLFCCFKRN